MADVKSELMKGALAKFELVDRITSDYDKLKRALGGTSLTDLQILTDINRLIASMPSQDALVAHEADALRWAGETAALLKQWDGMRGLTGQFAFDNLANPQLWNPDTEYAKIQTLMHEARRDLELKADPDRAVAIPKGGVFDYFEAIRDRLKLAKVDLLVVDRFLNDEFVSRFFPQIDKGVRIRILARDRLAQLIPAVDLWCQQNGTHVEIRRSDDFHDRHIIIDGEICIFSGASFKDGGKHPSVVAEVADNRQALIASYEVVWAAATPVFEGGN